MCYTARQYERRVRDLLDLKRLEADIQKQIEVLENDIKNDMGDVEQVLTPNYSIEYKTINSNRFDSKAFKVAHEKLYAQFVKPATCRRFTVKTL